MRIEVDQSGKIERTQTNTALAFSNDAEFSVLILAVEKRECLHRWRQRGKTAKTLYLRLFAGALFLLLRDHLHQIGPIVIDPEYPGRESEIRTLLLQHIRKIDPNFAAERIAFHQVGKHSRAHVKAISVFRGMESAGRKIRARELLDLVK